MARSDTHTSPAGCVDGSGTGLNTDPAADRRAFAPAIVSRRLLLVPAALLVLWGTEAVLAAVTVGLLWLIPVDQTVARLHVSGLARIEVDPHTAVTALVTLALSATLAAVLLRSRSTLAQFAAIKVFALVVATAITGAYAPGSLRVQIAVACVGAGAAVLMWPRMRVAVPRVLETINIRHVDGRAADMLLVLKISVLVGLIVLLG
ncbi:histidine kinase [Frankia sp. AgPm24]|uniref:Histidine kinase n=1 Tax=Frankia umida TaxID=573489 RepID=A0ABT0K3M4_9ACTN|nr:MULTISPECIES: histidine kinase [Frankia]MCK9878385.1 histidine kinase [Frankia umida]MCK9925502.1 histidine kinase [Frankia sp. AgPm24]